MFVLYSFVYILNTYSAWDDDTSSIGHKQSKELKDISFSNNDGLTLQKW